VNREHLNGKQSSPLADTTFPEALDLEAVIMLILNCPRCACKEMRPFTKQSQ
jgi:hypothetical protein